MTSTNEGRASRTQFAQLQALFELANVVTRAQDDSEICPVAVNGLVRAIAASVSPP